MWNKPYDAYANMFEDNPVNKAILEKQKQYVWIGWETSQLYVTLYSPEEALFIKRYAGKAGDKLLIKLRQPQDGIEEVWECLGEL